MTVAPAYVALGSNLGEPVARLRQAALYLEALGTVLARSAIYRTAPVGGPPGQAAYLNAVVALVPRAPATAAGARSLLAALLDGEAALGRVRGERWGPRVIDLDLLAWGALEVKPVGAADADRAGGSAGEDGTGAGLVLPHPRLRERAFVLVPLCDADRAATGGLWVDPVTGRDACALADALVSLPGAPAVARTDLRW